MRRGASRRVNQEVEELVSRCGRAKLVQMEPDLSAARRRIVDDLQQDLPYPQGCARTQEDGLNLTLQRGWTQLIDEVADFFFQGIAGKHGIDGNNNQAAEKEQQFLRYQVNAQLMSLAAKDAIVKSIPVGRIGVPEDLWIAVKFVLECDYFNGRTIDVDGGAGL